MDLMPTVNSLFENYEDYDDFHDVVYEASGISHPKEKLIALFLKLPHRIQMTAVEWGLSDTVFGDEVYVYITTQKAAGTLI